MPSYSSPCTPATTKSVGPELTPLTTIVGNSTGPANKIERVEPETLVFAPRQIGENKLLNSESLHVRPNLSITVTHVSWVNALVFRSLMAGLMDFMFDRLNSVDVVQMTGKELQGSEISTVRNSTDPASLRE